jgi:hypothetical protein
MKVALVAVSTLRAPAAQAATVGKTEPKAGGNNHKSLHFLKAKILLILLGVFVSSRFLQHWLHHVSRTLRWGRVRLTLFLSSGDVIATRAATDRVFLPL